MKTGIKTGILTLALLISAIASVSAQKKITFGIKAAANVSNISGHGHQNSTMPRYGYSAGLTVDYAVTNNFYILSGLEYTLKGFDTKSTEGFTGAKVEAGYVQLPIHAGYAIHVDNNTKVIFHAGPYAAYGVTGKTKVKGTNLKFDTFGKENLKEFDYGVGGGVDIDYKHFTIGVGYDHGLNNISRDKAVSIYNSVAQLKLGVKF